MRPTLSQLLQFCPHPARSSYLGASLEHELGDGQAANTGQHGVEFIGVLSNFLHGQRSPPRLFSHTALSLPWCLCEIHCLVVWRIILILFKYRSHKNISQCFRELSKSFDRRVKCTSDASGFLRYSCSSMLARISDIISMTIRVKSFSFNEILPIVSTMQSRCLSGMSSNINISPKNMRDKTVD